MASNPTPPTTPRGMQPPDRKPVRITVPEGPRRARYGDPFFPKVPFQAIFYVTAIFAALIFLAQTNPAPLEAPADPLNHAAIDPKPEWYFMFLFQLLKYFSGPWVPIGTVVIPTILVLLLVLLPFYDFNWARKPAKRPLAVLSMSAGMIGLFILTWGGFGFPKPDFSTTSSVATPPSSGGTTTAGPSISPQVAALFSSRCGACHIATASGGLNLNSYQALLKGGNVVSGPVVVPGDHAKSIVWQIVQPKGPWPAGNRMPLGGPYLSSADLTTLASWIDGLKESGDSTAGGSQTPAVSAQTASFKSDIQPIFQSRCAICHIQGQSGQVNLSSYATLVKSAPVGATSILKPGDHASSILWQVTQATAPWPGGVRMPANGQYMSQAQIDKIAAWIDQGAKDN